MKKTLGIFVFGLIFTAVFLFSSISAEAYTHVSTLRLGANSSQVLSLQQALNNAGFIVSSSGAGSVGKETTYFGARTKTAVIAFQKSKGLVADGIVGAKTGTSLSQNVASASFVGKSWIWQKTVTKDSTFTNTAVGDKFKINFDADNGVSGTDGCNSLGTTYTLDGNNITVSGDIVTTLKYCGQLTGESSAFSKFTNAASFRFESNGDLIFITKDGSSVYFKEEAPKVSGGCYVGGCSNQICTDKADGAAYSNCIALPEFACYKTATCERQISGECGWTKTNETTMCLNKIKS